MSRYPRHRQRASTTLSGEIVGETEKSVRFRSHDDMGEEFWIPRSVCQDGDSLEEGDGDLVVEDWWLKKEGRL